MANSISVITSNELLTKDGGYHEIHKISFLSSPEHALATVKSIIENNIKFTDYNCPLVGVDIECSNFNTCELIQNYYSKHSEGLNVRVGIK